MKIKSFLILILFFVMVIKIDAVIPLNQIKGLAFICEPTLTETVPLDSQDVNGNKFSPVWGAIVWNSSYIENLWRYGEHSSSTVRLIKELFFLHHDEVTFDVTYLPLKIGAHFSLENIGEIIGYIDNFYTSINVTFTGAALVKVVNEQKDIFKKQIDDLINRIEVQNKDLIKAKIKGYLSGVLRDIVREIQHLRKKLQRPNITPLFIAELNKKIDELTARKNKVESALNAENASPIEIVNKAYLENKTAFKNNLVKSLLERNYLPDNIIFLFLAFAWAKVENKEQFVDLFWGIYSKISDKQKLFRSDVFMMLLSIGGSKESFSRILLPRINMPEFDRRAYEVFKNAPYDQIKNQNIYNLEYLAFLYFGETLYDQFIPKAVSMIGDANFMSVSFPDCGEVSLLNFFIAILYDRTTNDWNRNILENIGFVPQVKDFFMRFKPFNVYLKLAHNAWANVVSAFPGVKYNKGNCDIAACVSNMLRVIGNLIPGVNNFESLKVRLRSFNVAINFRPEKNILENDCDNSIEFEIKKPENPKSFIIIWDFYPKHFEMVFSKLNNSSYFKEYRNAIKVMPKLNDYEKSKATVFSAILSANFADMISLNLGQRFEHSYFFMKNMGSSSTEKFLYMKNLINVDLNWGENSANQFKSDLIRAIYANLHRDDEYIVTEFFDILNHSNLDIFDPKNKVFNGLILQNKKELFVGILYCIKKGKYFDWVEEVLPRIDLKNFNSYILGVELLSFIKKAKGLKPSFIEVLYKFIFDVALTLEDENHKINYIGKILDLKGLEDKKLKETLYEWVLRTLPMIGSEENKFLLSYLIITFVDIAELGFKPFFINFYLWINNIYFGLSDIYKKQIIDDLIKNPIPQDPDYAKIYRNILGIR